MCTSSSLVRKVYNNLCFCPNADHCTADSGQRFVAGARSETRRGSTWLRAGGGLSQLRPNVHRRRQRADSHPHRATRLASHCADCRARRRSLFIRGVTKPPPSNGKYRSGPRRSRSARVPAPTSGCSQPVLEACLLSHPRIRVEVAQHDARQPVRMCTESRHAPERQEGAMLAESSTGTKGHIRAGMREH